MWIREKHLFHTTFISSQLLVLLAGEYESLITDVDQRGDENEQEVKRKPIL